MGSASEMVNVGRFSFQDLPGFGIVMIPVTSYDYGIYGVTCQKPGTRVNIKMAHGCSYCSSTPNMVS